VGALRNNGNNGDEGIADVAPDGKLIAISTDFGMDENMKRGIAAGINWAWKNGADVISNSWGNTALVGDYITDAIDSAVIRGRNGLGCVVVFCTHNQDSYISYPATLPNVIAVGAISPCGERKRTGSDPQGDPCDTEEDWGSNYGPELDVVAPGVLISTTDNREGNINNNGYKGYNPCTRLHLPGWGGGTLLEKEDEYDDQDYTIWFNGTSAATPHVAGVAALILSVNPDLTTQQVKDIIESTARNVGGYDYQTTPGRHNGLWHIEMGYGLVDAYEAVKKAQCIVNLFDKIITISRTVTSCGDINVQRVKVQGGAKLTLDAAGEVIFNGDFEVELGSELEIKY
jgi:subtilisin family serine protease